MPIDERVGDECAHQVSRNESIGRDHLSEFCMGLRPIYMDETHLESMSFDGVGGFTARWTGFVNTGQHMDNNLPPVLRSGE